MIEQLDHVVVLVPELDEAVEAYRQAGFTVVRGGVHPGGTHNALISFADGSYLELLAFYSPNPDHWWYRFLQSGGGIIDLCLLTRFLEQEVEQLVAHGLAYPLSEGSRRRPDGYELRWRMARPPSQDTGVLPFLIEDVTPRSERVPGGTATKHPNGAVGIREIVIVTDDLALRTRQWRLLLGDTAHRPVNHQPLAHQFRIGSHWVTLVSSKYSDGGERYIRIGEGPFLVRIAASSSADLRLLGAQIQLL